MKQAKWLSEFSCLSEYTRLYPNVPFVRSVFAKEEYYSDAVG